mgnify:CR=1 FL=1
MTEDEEKQLKLEAAIPVRQAGYRSVREYLIAMLKRVIANPKAVAKPKGDK